MNMLLLIFVAHVCFALVSGQGINYCDSNLCQGGARHIGCNNNGAFDRSCPADRAMMSFSSYEIQQILETHNSLRNRIAIGQEPGFKTASKMATLAWSDELANLAALNVKQCRMEHDQCRNTFQFRFSGQNLGYRANSMNFEGMGTFLNNVMFDWYNEIKYAQQSSIDQCCGGANFSKIGHFLQVVQDNARFVGCAASRYTNPNSRASKTILLACNYSYANILGQRVYQTGAPASACQSGRNPKYTGLCQ